MIETTEDRITVTVYSRGVLGVCHGQNDITHKHRVYLVTEWDDRFHVTSYFCDILEQRRLPKRMTPQLLGWIEDTAPAWVRVVGTLEEYNGYASYSRRLKAADRKAWRRRFRAKLKSVRKSLWKSVDSNAQVCVPVG